MNELPCEAPECFDVSRVGNKVLISRKWFYVSRTLLPLFVLGVILFEEPNPLDLWPVIVLAVYLLLVCVLNKTTITVGIGRLLLSHGPIPFPFRRSRKIEMNTIERVETRYHAGSKRDAATGTYKKTEGYTYEIGVKLRDGRLIKLLTFPEKEEAEYLKQQIHQFIT